MKFYISSQCSPKKRMVQAVEELASLGFTSIELTGGTAWYPELLAELQAAKNRLGIELMVHNYFPPQPKEFVLNLAVKDPVRRRQMMAFIKEAVVLSKGYGNSVYGVHPGFRQDVAVEQEANGFFKAGDPALTSVEAFYSMLDELNEVAKVTAIEKPYKLTLLESDIPRDMKAVAIRKVGMLQYMEPGCGEYCKLKNWVEAFMQIPFGKNKNLPITIADGVDRCHDFMTAAKTRLDTAVYGLNDAKMQIMQMVGQWIANPAAIGTAVAIHGPPGTGKTSLVKEGISKILGRDFAFIALGGATDSSFLEGHSYTYEGSMWGKIVDILIRCKSSNPVIYFDELDKISETSKGEEIVGILTHLTDTSQNSQFHDKYFSEVAFDLSKCLFIFSYNDESRVNPVLLDRMYKIRTTGYNTKDKTFIAQHHLIPRICAEVAFAEGDIIIPDSVVEYIVDHCTHREAGVRNLKRCLEIIYTKLNLYRLMRPGTQLFDDKEMSLEVSFPYTVSREVVDKLIKKGDTDRPNINMYL